MERPFKFHQLTLFVDYLYDNLDQLSQNDEIDLSEDDELGWTDIEGALEDFELDFNHFIADKIYNRLDEFTTTDKRFSYDDLLVIIENYKGEL